MAWRQAAWRGACARRALRRAPAIGLKRALQNLVIAAAAQSFLAIFVTHDLAEAVRVADRLVLLSREGGRVLDSRAITGRRDQRSDRDIFDMVAPWSREPAFGELFDPRRQA